MRHVVSICLLAVSVLLTSSALHAAPDYDWSRGLGGPGLNAAYDVAVDGSGNVVIVGTFAGTMNFGGTVLTSAGSSDIFLAKFDADGVLQWSQVFGGTGPDAGLAVAVDGAANIIITGFFRGPVSFGGSPLAGRGAQDIFVARFNAAGTHQWSQWCGSSGNDQGQAVVADASGNVIVTGHFGGAMDFGSGTKTPVGSLDAFVLKLDAAGSYQWSRTMGGFNPDIGYGVAADASGNVFVTGSFSNSVDFGGGPVVSAGSSDVFVAKYDAAGAHQWSVRLGGTAADVGYGIGTDATGAVVVTGVYDGAFLVRYDGGGVQEWMETFTSTVMIQGMDLAVSPSGAIAVTGNLRGTTDLGDGQLTSAGDDDIFLALRQADGSHRWSRQFGNINDDWGYGCAFDPSGNLIAAGIFSASVDFGGGALVSEGLSDVFAVKFDDPVPDTTPPLIACPGDIELEQTVPGGVPATDPAIAAFLSGVSVSDDSDPAPVIIHNAPQMFPVGTTPVTFRAVDAAGNDAECTAMVSVLEAAAPAEITVTLDKNVLWPPDHKFVTVCATVNVPDDASFWLVSITCNESPNGTGDGNTSPDIRNAEFGTADLCFDLRAERAGNGIGRVYEIVYGASNGSADAVYATVQVRVPHDMSDVPSLTSVYPNPFNPQTTLEYSVFTANRVQLTVYDARGAMVRRLVDEAMPAGDYRVTWTGTDQAGRPVSSGIYFVRMTAGLQVDTRKIVLLK